MKQVNKTGILTILGTAGAFIANLFGGWDAALTTLLIFMAIDYLLGLIVAAVFHKSNKSESGGLDSRAGLKGLLKKGMVLLIVLVAARLDIMIGSNFIKDGVVIAFVANETISIIENAGIMGVPIPSVITNAIDILQRKSEKKDGVNA
jgi:toxin secretion/phage lysis holin